jgi:hypothetical protein
VDRPTGHRQGEVVGGPGVAHRPAVLDQLGELVVPGLDAVAGEEVQTHVLGYCQGPQPRVLVAHPDERLLVPARDRLDSDTFDVEWAKGQAMRREDAIAYALVNDDEAP